MISEQGWYEMLRQFTTAGAQPEGSSPVWTVLWLYLPDFNNEGNMNVIKNIPRLGNNYNENDLDPYWKEDESCSGFIVDDGCNWRWEEMNLITFTPQICLD